MKKKDILEISIDKMLYAGESVNNTQCDKKIVMKGGIRGQKVRALVQKIRKDKVQAKILEVVEKSPLETQTVCKQYGRCGGCTMLSVDYDNQIIIKKEQLLELFHKNGHHEISDIEVLKSQSQHEYKNKMEFTFGNEEKDGELVVGLHRKNSAMSIVSVHDCQLVDEDYRKILKTTEQYFREKNIPHYHIMAHKGYLRHLVIRKGTNTNQLLINIVTTSQLEFDLSQYIKLLLNLELKSTITGILHTINDSLSDTVTPEKVELLYGQMNFYDKLMDKTFKISPFSFFQTNTNGAQLLYKTAIDMIDDKKNIVFDLYSGTGTIGISLSNIAKQVFGIEIIKEAVEMAKENASNNNIDNIIFIAGDVKEEVTKLLDGSNYADNTQISNDSENLISSLKPKKNVVDLIVLDPPRAGISPKALSDVIGYQAKQILYISCNPKMLVQDLVVLKEHGYIIKAVKGVDMFPNTPHCETICYLSLK